MPPPTLRYGVASRRVVSTARAKGGLVGEGRAVTVAMAEVLVLVLAVLLAVVAAAAVGRSVRVRWLRTAWLCSRTMPACR